MLREYNQFDWFSYLEPLKIRWIVDCSRLHMSGQVWFMVTIGTSKTKIIYFHIRCLCHRVLHVCIFFLFSILLYFLIQIAICVDFYWQLLSSFFIFCCIIWHSFLKQANKLSFIEKRTLRKIEVILYIIMLWVRYSSNPYKLRNVCLLVHFFSVVLEKLSIT